MATNGNRDQDQVHHRLRARAERRKQLTQSDIDALPEDDARHLLHELQVHQIELEMQNEELRETQMQLESARQKYKDLYEFAPVGYLTIDPDGVVLEANLAVSTQLGVLRKNLIDGNFKHLLSLESQRRYNEHYHSVIVEDTKQTTDIAYSSGSGEVVLQLVSVPCDDPKQPYGCIRVALMDITRRVEAKRALERHREMLQTVVDNVPTMVILLDRALRLQMVNRYHETFHGIDRNDVLGQHVRDVLGPETAAALRPAYDTALTGKEICYEVKVPNCDGELRHLAATLVPLREQNAITGFFVFAHDVTADRRTQQTLESARDTLESEVAHRTAELDTVHKQLIQSGKLAALGEMATGIAHELNQPLGIINMSCDIALKRLQALDDNTLEETIETILRNVERAAKIIRHLRMFAHDSGDTEWHEVNLNQILNDALGMVDWQLHKCGIEVNLELAHDLPDCTADHSQIEQIIVNLLNNARDALDDVEHKQIWIRSYGDPRDVYVEVRDSGPGIEADVLDRVFDPFFTTKDVGEGTGLGLSISHGIAEAHGGSLRATSGPDGTTFTLRLPSIDAT